MHDGLIGMCGRMIGPEGGSATDVVQESLIRALNTLVLRNHDLVLEMQVCTTQACVRASDSD